MGSGDWNDGMNRVGHHGKGESVWLAWFLATTARAFAAVAMHRGNHERVRWCNELQGELARAVESAWDGAWYRRAWFDDGTPIGSRSNTECRIDAIAQSWSVIAGIGDPAKAREAVAASERELVRPKDRMMRLLTPPFAATEPDPGYIRAYPAGIRENGGQYTHGVLWTVQALALLGEGDRALALLSMLNPLNHARTPEEVARYQVEPYVVAADVYDAPGHVGRGGWTWYSGAASVMYRVLLHDILGIKREGATLRIDPCVARTWRTFEVTYRDGEGSVHVVVDNPNGVQRGVSSIEIDGAPAANGVVPLTGQPGVREVRVVMGQSQPP
jgi:cyclic beta-1,2-glucan synthetase